MKVLAISSEGDPLFVRDEQGRDFEVEVRWASDARFRDWAKDPETEWDEVWKKVYQRHLPADCGCGGRNYAGHASVPCTSNQMRAVLTDATRRSSPMRVEPALVKPVARFLTASFLPSLAKRDMERCRDRAIVRLGGEAHDDVVERREESHQRLWAQQHPKARPSHPAIYISDRETFPTVSQWIPSNTAKIRFTNIEADVAAAAASVSAALTLDEVQKRRMDAMKRLQDPPEPEFDESVQQNIRHMMDGLRARPVL